MRTLKMLAWTNAYYVVGVRTLCCDLAFPRLIDFLPVAASRAINSRGRNG